MMDWDKLRIFHAVATAQSLTKAGEVLNLSQSAVSRQISALEGHLHVSLFHRHARGLVLTEQGEILLKAANEIFSKLNAAENALIETRERPRGPLKITAPVGFGTLWLTPLMPAFSAQYPDITPTLLVDDRELDLTMREADVAIRLYPAKHPDLVQKTLCRVAHSLYASNDYLRAHGVPKKVEDVSKHHMIAYPEDMRLPYAEVNWHLLLGASSKEPHRPVFSVNSMLGIKAAMEAGAGIAALPDYVMAGLKNVAKVLPEVKGPEVELYFIYPLELRQSRRINVFKEFLVQQLQMSGLASKDTLKKGAA
jgi:DNA-binding transcriptional LysR family regulator